jgi:hypothetical protein
MTLPPDGMRDTDPCHVTAHRNNAFKEHYP